MNKLLIVTVILVGLMLIGCSKSYRVTKGLEGLAGSDGTSCSVVQTSTGANLVCEDGSSAVINNGTDGAQGVAGDAGIDGVGCSVQSVLPGGPAPNGGALITCADTSTLVLNGSNGLDGAQGVQGETGATGETGVAGADGQDGQDGADAPPTAYSVTELIDPCGTQTAYDEILLKLANGSIIASFSANQSGLNTRLSVVPPGNYVTTDNSGCSFTVHNDMTVSW